MSLIDSRWPCEPVLYDDLSVVHGPSVDSCSASLSMQCLFLYSSKSNTNSIALPFFSLAPPLCLHNDSSPLGGSNLLRILSLTFTLDAALRHHRQAVHDAMKICMTIAALRASQRITCQACIARSHTLLSAIQLSVERRLNFSFLPDLRWSPLHDTENVW